MRTLKQGSSAEAPRHYWEAQQDSAEAPHHYWSRSEIGIGLEQPPGEGSVAAQVACLHMLPFSASHTAVGQQQRALKCLHACTQASFRPHMIQPDVICFLHDIMMCAGVPR